MNSPLKPATVAMLSLAPALWAGNAIVGRLAHDLISPFALNFLRWCIAFVLLLFINALQAWQRKAQGGR